MGAKRRRAGLNILFVTPEVRPFSMTGGLADVSGALPRALARAAGRARILPAPAAALAGSTELDRALGHLGPARPLARLALPPGAGGSTPAAGPA